MKSSRMGFALLLSAAAAIAAAAQESPPARPDVGVLGAAEPLLVTDYHVDVAREGPAYQASAQVVLRNPRSATVEGVALIPIPEQSIPRGFIVENGELRMKGVVRARERAIDVYRGITRAPRGGKDPAVLERLGDRWLRATVSPIAASGQLRLSIGYLGFTEKLGDHRSLDLPSERTAFRGAWAGTSRRLLAGDAITGPVTTWCFRAPGADGSFCIELDPAELLEKPLARATYLLVLETPESTSEGMTEAGATALAGIVGSLAPEDTVELYSNRCEGGFFGAPVAADANVRERLAGELRSSRPGGWGHLDLRLHAALVTAATVGGPVRIVVASAQRRIARCEELAEAVTRASVRLGQGFALFTCALGSRADGSALATLAASGSGRAFSILGESETPIVAPPLAAAVRRPVLIAPRASVAGATELMVERKRHVTYGETLRLSGRYAEGSAALVRLEGHVLDGCVDAMWETRLDDENVTHPWVATLWAGLRARDLRGQSEGDDALAYLVRLAERFSLIGPETVSLGLEPALADRLPPLMGSGDALVAELDSPERPNPPGRPEVPENDPRDRRPPPIGPAGPGLPGGFPLAPPPPARPASVPSPGPAGPAPSIPSGRGGHGGGH